jgi:ATP-dependent Lon protease
MSERNNKPDSKEREGGKVEIPTLLPVLPLIDVVAFPNVGLPLSVGRPKSLSSVERALSGNRFILLVAQRQRTEGDPVPGDLFRVGTAAIISRMLKLPDGTLKLIVQGLSRVNVVDFLEEEGHLNARVDFMGEPRVKPDDVAVHALVRTVRENFSRAGTLSQNVTADAIVMAQNLDDPGRLADLVTGEMRFRVEDAQMVLEAAHPVERLTLVNRMLLAELEILSVQQRIDAATRGEIDKNQREYYLRQQLKAIQEELGETSDMEQEIEDLRKKVEEAGMSEEAKEESLRQLKRLERMNHESAEAGTARSYLEWMTELPWKTATVDTIDIPKAQQVLDEDHYGLDEAKKRILEYLSVRKLKENSKGPILCFVGPPGVGKTSLGRSIARALGRKFVRLSLGGVRDEAEIRGHRRTYVAALPGRILQGLRQAGSRNPVFVLDEVDKLGTGVHGDPSSALLEVLDPEQNNTFRDHYLGVPFDLSAVMFITTANALYPIQPAFRDRMEVLEIPGYTQEEKLEIARRHLIPKQIEEAGLKAAQATFTSGALDRMISEYTREAGVRNLERNIASVLRKVARKVAEGVTTPRFEITERNLDHYLGVPKVHPEHRGEQDEIGVAAGLAVTLSGGSLLFVEAMFVPGRGHHLTLTGQLGETMQESAKAALSYARSRAREFKIDSEFFAKHDLHLHVPAGAIPKDGPSAGITMATAIVSAAARIPVSRDVAMTGEITLRGNVLPIGGVKEKMLAAKMGGIPVLLLPKENQAEFREIPRHLSEGLKVHFVEHMDQVLRRALARPKHGPKASPRSGRGSGKENEVPAKAPKRHKARHPRRREREAAL